MAVTSGAIEHARPRVPRGRRTRGRRLAAYGAGLMAVLFGAASVFQPTASGLDLLWAGLAVLWAIALVGAYELSARRALPGPTAADESPTTGRGY